MSLINLLLVDDETEYLAAVTERLAGSGFNVMSAADGEEALQIMKRKQIDVVVLDVIMPGLSGLETLAEIKKEHPDTEVIMLSGFADIDAAVKCMTAGAFDYLTKPVALQRLLSRVRDADKRKQLKQNLKKSQAERAGS